MYTQTYSYTCVHTNTHISNYNLFKLYNVPCMYTFRADHVVWISD